MSSIIEQQAGFFQWAPQPDAAALVGEAISSFTVNCPAVARFADRLLHETATRLIDWTDHIALPANDQLQARLERTGFVPRGDGPGTIWEHPCGLFPQVILHPQEVNRLAVRVESADDFMAALGLDNQAAIEGGPLQPLQRVRVSAQDGFEFWAVERHGYRGWELCDVGKSQIEAVRHFSEAFQRRPRQFEDAERAFTETRRLIAAAVAELGTGRAADLFFDAERRYWTARNRAARFQKGRQDALGLGWANHDHHTYRSSRQHFPALIAVLEELGFHCRERFYAGREAGWGAQVLEQEESQVVIFADVDLSADEVAEDFAHAPLVPRPEFGTVGLWCLLHGEAFLEAGMHHLECRFDYEAARSLLERAGIGVMRPFTDLPYLKQAFTEAELWKVSDGRAAAAVAAGAITAAQAEQFRTVGALGSHLEILQRDDGYKGFNQSGISEIIRATDPRN